MKNVYKIGTSTYITNNEEIKEGDWCLHNGILKRVLHIKYSGAIIVFNVGNGSIYGHKFKNAKKIILTDDIKLISEGIQPIDDTFLEWFVRNPSFEYIEWSSEKIEGSFDGENWKYKYGTVIPREEPKQDLEKEMFDLEQELDIPSHLRWHNSKPKQEKLKESAENFANSKEWMSGKEYWFKIFQEQDKNKYSEEEVLNFANFYHGYKEVIKTEKWEIIEESKEDLFKKWLKHYKKIEV
jgi:hypothetical protein